MNQRSWTWFVHTSSSFYNWRHAWEGKQKLSTNALQTSCSEKTAVLPSCDALPSCDGMTKVPTFIHLTLTIVHLVHWKQQIFPTSYMCQTSLWKPLRDESLIKLNSYISSSSFLSIFLPALTTHVAQFTCMTGYEFIVSSNGYTYLLCWQYTTLQKFSRMPQYFAGFKSIFEQCTIMNGKKWINWAERSMVITFL